jgi:hypothetical protein
LVRWLNQANEDLGDVGIAVDDVEIAVIVEAEEEEEESPERPKMEMRNGIP